jgi:formamidopyrimidine-DNA glycosylase
MPELPEVETVRRGLQPVMEGQRILRVETRRGDLRFPLQPDFTKRLDDQLITGLGRRAKYLTCDLASGDVLLMHLGMSGSFRVIEAAGDKKQPGEFHYPRAKDTAHDHIVFHMASGATVSFNDPRRFGYMKIVRRDELEDEPFLKGLGPEPLGNEFDAAMLAHACAGKKTSLKAALLDQRVVAGLGNIYVCEALHRAHLSPKRSASTLAAREKPTERARHLVGAIHKVLNDAIAAGGSSLRDHRQTNGELGYFQKSFRVYGREGEKCVTPKCQGVVKRFNQNGRSTFWCPVCQK